MTTKVRKSSKAPEVTQPPFECITKLVGAAGGDLIERFYESEKEWNTTLFDLLAELEMVAGEIQELMKEYGEDAPLKDFEGDELPEN